MPGTSKDKTAIVGMGATPCYRRGESLPQTGLELACQAILDDAGLTSVDLDGFTIYSSSRDPAQVASVLGVPEVRLAASLTSGDGARRAPARRGGEPGGRRRGGRGHRWAVGSPTPTPRR